MFWKSEMYPASALKVYLEGICTLFSLSFRTSVVWAEKYVAMFYKPMWVNIRWEKYSENPVIESLSFTVHSCWYYTEIFGKQQYLPTLLYSLWLWQHLLEHSACFAQRGAELGSVECQEI